MSSTWVKLDVQGIIPLGLALIVVIFIILLVLFLLLTDIQHVVDWRQTQTHQLLSREDLVLFLRTQLKDFYYKSTNHATYFLASSS
jgi:hypothetical protein